MPEDVELSQEGRDFLSRLLMRDRTSRLGVNGPSEVKEHPWLKDIDWTKLRSRKSSLFLLLFKAYLQLTCLDVFVITESAPWVPELEAPEDTKFAAVEDEEFNINRGEKKFWKPDVPQGGSLRFVGYTYLRHATAQLSWTGLGDEVLELPPLPSKSDSSALEEAKKKCDTLELTNKDLSTQITALLAQVSKLRDAEAGFVRLEKERLDWELEQESSKRRLRTAVREKEELEQKVLSLEEELSARATVASESDSGREIQAELEEKKLLCVELEASLSAAQAAKSSLDTRVQEQKASYENQILDLKTQISSLQQSLTDEMARTEHLQAERDGLVSKVEDLNEALRASRNREASLSSRLAAEQATSAEQAARATSAQTDLENARSQLSQAATRNEQLVAEVERLSSDKTATSGLQSLLEDSRNQMAKCEEELAQCRTQRTSDEIEKAQLAAKLASEVQTRAGAETRLAEMTEDLKTKTTQLDSIQLQLIQSKSIAESLRSQRFSAEEGLKAMQSVVEGLQQQVDDAAAMSRDMEGEKARLQAMLKIGEDRLAKMQKDLVHVERDKAAAEDRLRQTKEERDAAKKQVTELLSEIRVYQQRIEDAQSLEMKLKIEIHDSKTELSRKDEQLEELSRAMQAEEEKSRRAADERSSECDSLIAELARMRDQLQESEHQRAELQDRLLAALQAPLPSPTQIVAPAPHAAEQSQARPVPKRSNSAKRRSVFGLTNLFSRKGATNAIPEKDEDSGRTDRREEFDDSRSEISEMESLHPSARRRRPSSGALSLASGMSPDPIVSPICKCPQPVLRSSFKNTEFTCPTYSGPTNSKRQIAGPHAPGRETQEKFQVGRQMDYPPTRTVLRDPYAPGRAVGWQRRESCGCHGLQIAIVPSYCRPLRRLRQASAFHCQQLASNRILLRSLACQRGECSPLVSWRKLYTLLTIGFFS